MFKLSNKTFLSQAQKYANKIQRQPQRNADCSEITAISNSSERMAHYPETFCSTASRTSEFTTLTNSPEDKRPTTVKIQILTR